MARLTLSGTAVSPGIAFGPVRLLAPPSAFTRHSITPGEVEAEENALLKASTDVRLTLEAALRQTPESMPEYREVMASQVELVRDSKIIEPARARIRRRNICATWALQETVDELCALFEGLGDPYLRALALDIRAIGHRLTAALGGKRTEPGSKGILAARELTPLDVLDLRSGRVLGIATMEGSPNSHASILARTMKAPIIVGVEGLLGAIREGEETIVDGLTGRVLLGPDAEEISSYRETQVVFQNMEAEAASSATAPAVTKDGIRIYVGANLDNQLEIGGLAACGAECIGLYRTEFAYLEGKCPSEEDLFLQYSDLVRRCFPARVVFRALDVGADKLLPPQAAMREPNPALGLRGIRFCLRNENIFRVQLAAILRAAHEGDAALMLPMISNRGEIARTREILADVKSSLDARGLPYSMNLPLGAMIETPAAVWLSDELAEDCDFFSIGTNDLIHYLLSIDRSNSHVQYLNDPLHPAVMRSLKKIVDSANRRNIPVSICGELAADPGGIAIFLGLGIHTLSASPRFVPYVKHILRRLDAGACADLVDMLLETPDSGHCRAFFLDALKKLLGKELYFRPTAIA